jgi:transposase-like protein
VLVELGVVGQRYRAVLEVLDEGVPVTVVALRYGVARQTVHQWLRRYADEGGLGGLADRSPKPDSCPHQMSAVVEARVVRLRREHPGVGAAADRLGAGPGGRGAAAGPLVGLPGAGAPWPDGGEEAPAAPGGLPPLGA